MAYFKWTACSVLFNLAIFNFLKDTNQKAQRFWWILFPNWQHCKYFKSCVVSNFSLWYSQCMELSHCAHNCKEKQRKSVVKWLLEATKSQKFCQKMPFFCHEPLHKLTKCHFSQNLSVRLFFSYLHTFLNIISECFTQKTQG